MCMKPYREILLAVGYKSFEWRSCVLLLLAHCSHVSPISRYAEDQALTEDHSSMVRITSKVVEEKREGRFSNASDCVLQVTWPK